MSDNARTQRSRVAVEESFVVDVQSYLQELMNLRGMTRSELANAMGVSRARVTQIFSDECTNLTVRLLARAAHALGEEPEVTSEAVRRIREGRAHARRSAALQGQSNVVPLRPMWVDESETSESELVPCNENDSYLDTLVERVCAVGA